MEGGWGGLTAAAIVGAVVGAGAVLVLWLESLGLWVRERKGLGRRIHWRTKGRRGEVVE